MLTPNTALHAEQDALLVAIGAVLSPLAQLCVARACPSGGGIAAAAQLRTGRVAGPPGVGHGPQHQPGQCHHRPDAARGRPPAGERSRPGTAVPLAVVPGVHRWLTDPALRDAQQHPIALPRQGDAPSFEALAQSVTRDVHPRTLLDELCRLNLVSLDTRSDTVRLQTDAFVPRGDWARMVGFLGQNVGDHLRAATANVLGNGQQHFEQAIHADELSDQSMAAVRQMVSREWKQLLDTLVPQIEALIEQDRLARRPMDQQVRIGFFSWTEPMHPLSHNPRSPP